MVSEKMAGKISNFYRGKIQIFIFIREKIYILNVLLKIMRNLRIIRFKFKSKLKSNLELRKFRATDL